jgi:hypothetical protein
MLVPKEACREIFDQPYPAMVFPVVNSKGELVGAQRTLLSKDDTSRIKGHKRSYGNISGGYVPLGTASPDRPLLVAEGIETGLAGRQITGLPAIATLGTSGMKTVNIPDCAEVIILADPGDAGREAATYLAERTALHRPTRVVVAPEGSDWADVLLKYQHDDASLLDFKRRIRKARQFTAKPLLRAVSREEFCSLDIPKIHHFLDPILPVAGATVIHGQKCNGKSRLVLSMAECMAIKGTCSIGSRR